MTDQDRSASRQTGDWPIKAAHSQPASGDEVVLSRQLERELRLGRQKHMPAWLSFGIGIGLSILAYVVFAIQQGSFAGVGAVVDSRLSAAQDKGVAAGQKAADATGDAARHAGANIHDALERTTRKDGKADPSSKPPPKN